MPHIDLNCDLGESFGAYTIGMDEKVISFITSANVACGFHAGDPLVMQRTVALCKQSGAAVGAHPGFPDLQGFGRRQMKLTPAEAKACVQYQIGALKAFCDAAGVPLHHVKPHGALYNMAGKDRALADAICAAVKESAPGAVLLALSGSEMVKAANAIGLPVASEVFADRGYRADGSLVPRGAPGAMIEDEDTAIARVLQMAAQGTVQADDGSTVLFAERQNLFQRLRLTVDRIDDGLTVVDAQRTGQGLWIRGVELQRQVGDGLQILDELFQRGSFVDAGQTSVDVQHLGTGLGLGHGLGAGVSTVAVT